ncbi:protein kinase domain-containing protein [Luteimonas sp. RIT-PG2_3]
MPTGTYQTDPPPFPEIPGYRLSRVIGKGGMSTVYLGTQLSLSREVAIKVMLSEALADEVSRRRFENEARTIARLEHPHIVGIHEVGRTTQGQPWYAMPHLSGGHLGQRDFTQSHDRVRDTLQALLSALSFAHARGVVHRDVKAENVLFDEADRPLLADFGIALRRGHGTRVTMTGLAVGSTAYMAPEQARGQQVDQRADLYSVGVLTWEMLTGELPYKADDALAMAIQHTQNPIPRLPARLRHWQRFVDRAMAKSPRKRFHDARQMLEALDQVRWLDGRQEPWSTRLRKYAQSLVRPVPRVALIPVGLLAAGVIGVALQRDRGWSLGEDFRTPDSQGTAVPSDASAEASIDTPSDGNVAEEAAASTDNVSPDADTLPGNVIDATRALHRAAPESIAGSWLATMDRRLANGVISVADSRNAADSLISAWQADPAHLQLPAATQRLLHALGNSATRAIAANEDAQAQALLAQAMRAARTLGVEPADPALETLRSEVDKAIAARIGRSRDPAVAVRSIESARIVGLAQARIDALLSRANARPRAAAGSNIALLSLDVAGRQVQVFAAPVNRIDYARFAEASQREPGLCRERGSLLRVLSPRDWTTPGFAQAGTDPVVCVSWQDAKAYAAWAGQRDGQRYRLLTAEEARALPSASAAKPTAEWRADCGKDCARRLVTGASWRTADASRALASDRGYDDVGFRLAIER